MKILHTADWHLGRRLDGRSRHDEQSRVLDEICAITADEDVDAVLIAGDIFDSYNPPAESESLFYTTMTRLCDGGRRAVIVIAGNHDSPDRLIASNPYARVLGISTLGYPGDIPERYDYGKDRVACVESAQAFIRLRLPRRKQYLSLLALPYPSEARLREIISSDLNDDESVVRDYNRRVSDFMQQTARGFLAGQPNIIASHLFVQGGDKTKSERDIEVGGACAMNAASFPAEAGYVALGHLHRPQEMDGQNDIRVRYSGSILQYSFSEAEQQKEVTIIEFDGAVAAHRSVPLNSGRMLRKWDLESTDELEHRLAEADPTDLLWINVAVEEPLPVDYIASLRREHAGIIQCLPVFRRDDDLQEEITRMSELPLDEQFRRFVQARYKEPCSEDVVRLFMELVNTAGEQP
jgi:DNA repair protein SbcD/Mre11